MSSSVHPPLAEQILLDNRFRLVVSLNALSIAAILSSMGYISSLKPFVWIFAFYSIPYGFIWLFQSRLKSAGGILRYLLSLTDFAAISATVFITGGPTSPFFYLYPIPFLIHALQFDLKLILWDGAASLLCYGALLALLRRQIGERTLELGIGQWAFLGLIIAAALWTAKRFRGKDDAVRRSVEVLHNIVSFLEMVNGLPPALTDNELHGHILDALHQALEPLHVHTRLWIANTAWRTLEGLGEHPALRPGSTHHLPVAACPAFAMRQPFHYDQSQGKPCKTEQFNYAKHLCLPVINEKRCFGVLFLASYDQGPWDTEEIHFFELLAHAIALTLQRRVLFETLEEKIGDLNFSFEVGAAALATFGGSTQSIEETTVHILDSVLSILKVDRASLMLWDAQSHRLQTQWVRGGNFKIQSPLTLDMGEGMAGWALQTGQPYWAEYAMGDPHYQPSAQPIKSLLCVPVFAMDRHPVGVINAVTTTGARAFLPREIEFLTSFGRQAALAIENARLHQKAKANIDQLHEVSQLKSQFLSLVSHDLRGPLTGIRGFCEILKTQSKGDLTPAQIEAIDQLQRQVDLQERMVDDLLDLARMEKGRLSVHLAPVDMATVLREEVEKSQIEARERNITLRLFIDDPAALQNVPADAGRMRQVIWNLIHNALKFTPEDGRVSMHAAASHDWLVIEVEDTGVGLSPETHDRVFDKFFQVSPGGSTSAQGLGLGLTICKEILVAHNGTISARSPGLGLGTTISFSLPLRAGAVQHPPKTLAA